ncbi:hypothetical protein [Paenibacillus ottowii]
MIWRWRRKPVMAKNLTGLSVLTDDHLECLAETYLQQEYCGMKLKDQIPFSVYVEVERKIKWEV